jgi:hypothetical protein
MNERGRRWLFLLLVLVLLLSISCNLGGLTKDLGIGDVNIGDVNVPDVEVDELVDSVSDEVLDLAQEGQDYAGTLEAYGANISLDDLKDLFSSVQLNGDGTATVTLTEEQVNQAAENAGTAGDSQGIDTSEMGDFTIAFSGGYVVLTGEVIFPPGEIKVVFQPYVENGVVLFSVVEASIGELSAPDPLIQITEVILNQILSSALNNVPAGMGIQSISVGEGTLTVVVSRGF